MNSIFDIQRGGYRYIGEYADGSWLFIKGSAFAVTCGGMVIKEGMVKINGK